MSPIRVQRKRTKGWRMPANTVYVGRPSKWGNPYAGTSMGAGEAVELFKDMLDRAPANAKGESIFQTIREELAGKNLACWCSHEWACHADVLLELANACDTGTPDNPCKGCPDCMGIPQRYCLEKAYFTGEQCILNAEHAGPHK